MRKSIRFVLILALLAGWAAGLPAKDQSPTARPRLLSTAARSRAVQATDVTAPVARRPAGTFEFPRQDQSSQPVNAGNRHDVAGSERSVESALVNTPVQGNPVRSPYVDNQGRLRGSSVAERMDGLRHRAVDADLGRSFVAAEPSPEFAVETRQSTVPARSPLRPQATPADVVAEDAEPAGIADVEEPVPTMDLDIEAGPTPTLAAPRAESSVARPTVVPLRTRAYSEPPLPEQNAAPAEPPAPSPRHVLFHNAAPAISFQTVGPRQIVIGREAAYRVMMSNHGDVSAERVIATVRLPAWTEILSSGATAGQPRILTQTGQDTEVQWEIPKLGANAEEILTLTLVPRDSRPFDLSVGWALAPGTAMAQIEVQEPKLEMLISGPDEVMYGATEVYTIALANPGSGDAENVVLNLLPVSAHQHMVGTRHLGTIRAGERKSIDIELTAHQAGRLQVKALAYGDGGLRTEAIQEVAVRRANLDMAVIGPPRNYAATVAAYRIRVENTGDATANNSKIVAALPRGGNYLHSTDGGKLNAQQGLVQWQIGSLRPGAVRIVELQVELNQAGDNRLDVQCQAEPDLSLAKSVVTHVEALADLKLFVNDPKGAVSVGQNSVYEVRIVNRGTKAAESVHLIGYFSEGIEPVALDGWEGSVAAGEVVFDPIPEIHPGQELVLRITARAERPGDHVFRAELTCRSPETRLASEEWTKYFEGLPDQMPDQIARQPENGSGRAALELPVR